MMKALLLTLRDLSHFSSSLLYKLVTEDLLNCTLGDPNTEEYFLFYPADSRLMFLQVFPSCCAKKCFLFINKHGVLVSLQEASAVPRSLVQSGA